jgi:tRNA-binding protein
VDADDAPALELILADAAHLVVDDPLCSVELLIQAGRVLPTIWRSSLLRGGQCPPYQSIELLIPTEWRMDTKATIQYDDFTKLDLRVATIVEAEVHPNADRLLKLQVDLGDERRQICAGIRQFAEPSDLVGKQIIVVANLAPRMIRGEESNGLLLAASVAEGEQLQDVVLLATARPVPPGTPVG